MQVKMATERPRRLNPCRVLASIRLQQTRTSCKRFERSYYPESG